MVDDLSGLEPPNELQAECYADYGLLEMWMAAGFTREEAFQLLLNLKRKTVSVILFQGEE